MAVPVPLRESISRPQTFAHAIALLFLETVGRSSVLTASVSFVEAQGSPATHDV
jgi:hypothetical protein